MDRYQENTTPEPPQCKLSEDFKTPDNTNGLIPLGLNGSAFPTPPSDEDDTCDSACTTAYTASTSGNLEFFKQQIQQMSAPSYPPHYNYNAIYHNAGLNDENLLPSAEKVAEVALASSRYKRRSRTTYTKQQLDVLEATFDKTQYPDVPIVDRLSSVLNLATERICIWFQNRRARQKKEKKIHSTMQQQQNQAWKMATPQYPMQYQQTHVPYEQRPNYYTGYMHQPGTSPLKPVNYQYQQSYNLLPQFEDLKNTNNQTQAPYHHSYQAANSYMPYYQYPSHSSN